MNPLHIGRLNGIGKLVVVGLWCFVVWVLVLGAVTVWGI